MNSNTLLLRVAAALFALFILQGCGQKGPLYLPDSGSSTQQHTSQ